MLDLDKSCASAITTRRRSPTAGAPSLTLDPELQEQAEKLLVEARAPRGAIVAMAPDGRILALAGSPHRRAQGRQGRHVRLAPRDRRVGAGRVACSSSSPRARSSRPASIPTTRSATTAAFARSIESNLRDTSATRNCETLALRRRALEQRDPRQARVPEPRARACSIRSRTISGSARRVPAFALPATFGELDAARTSKNLEFAQRRGRLRRLAALGARRRAARGDVRRRRRAADAAHDRFDRRREARRRASAHRVLAGERREGGRRG